METDELNAAFWSYVCGSQRKEQFGDSFDEWFFKRYPWLDSWIPFDELAGAKVLEVGIGSGAVTRRLSKICNLTALDIAKETLETLPCRTDRGSILEAPYRDNVFDYVVCIGCVHHTGNVPQALSEIYRILRPGGGTSLMVYHKNSGKEERPELWDADKEGKGPPFTEWFTEFEFQRLLKEAGFSMYISGIENYRAPNGLNVYAQAIK